MWPTFVVKKGGRGCQTWMQRVHIAFVWIKRMVREPVWTSQLIGFTLWKSVWCNEKGEERYQPLFISRFEASIPGVVY